MKFGVREIAFVAALLALLGCCYFFLFKPANEHREALRSEIREKQQELDDLRRATAGVKDLETRIDDLHRAITFFESKLPHEKEMDKVLKEVWKLAESNALQARRIRTLRSTKAAGYSEQPIELAIAGDFAGFYQFLLQMEKLPRIVRVRTMDLQKITDREGSMEARIEISIFFEPDGAISSAR